MVVVDDATKVSLAEVSLASLDGTPTALDEVVAGNEGVGSADEDSVGDETILADEAVLTVNEVEDVIRDAFAEADQLVSITNVQGAISVGHDLSSDSPRHSFGCTGIPDYPV